jgi:hypothetical protein
MQKILDALDKEGGQQTKDIVTALAGAEASDEAKGRIAADLQFLINEGYVAKLSDSRLFAQPVLSSQAQAKEEAANDEGAEESK